MSHSYQLTPYPVGSRREFWTMSWPLMLAMVSSTLMMFVDRLFLSRFEPSALNAAVSGGMAYFIFLVFPMAIAAISEVLVGRLHGADRHGEVGSAVWQMVWFGVFLTPIFLGLAFVMPLFLFRGTGIEVEETAYFRTMMFFALFQCTTIALSGFFIGIGKVKVVTISAVLGNLVNIALDYVLIFGWGPIPSFGVAGAAFATGLSLLVQTLFLLAMIFRKREREKYRTQTFGFSPHFFKEGLRIGTPSGLGHMLEVIAHFVFLRIVMSVGQSQMTIVAMVQSFYILFSFINDSASKAASAIVANLLGASVRNVFHRVLGSAFSLQVFYFLILMVSLFVFPDFLPSLFLSHPENSLLAEPSMRETFVMAIFYMAIFFLFDGVSWILIGFLTAAGDTRFIFWVSLIIHWGAYVVPTLFLIGMEHHGADVAWAIIAGMSLLTSLVYLVRYRTGAWLRRYQRI